MDITSIVVHPAYWRQGHAETMTKWMLQMIKGDGKSACVSAAPMGAKLFKAEGFKWVADVEVEGYEKHPEPVKLWFGVCDAVDSKM